MQLTRSEALFLYSVLFKSNVKSEFDGEYYDTAEDLMTKLRGFILDETEIQDEDEETNDSYEEEDEEESDEEEAEEHDDHVTADDLVRLPRLKTSTQDELWISSIVNEYAVIFALSGRNDSEEFEVSHIKRTEDSLEIRTEDEWLTFAVNKFPAKWKKLLTTDSVYLITDMEECE